MCDFLSCYLYKLEDISGETRDDSINRLYDTSTKNLEEPVTDDLPALIRNEIKIQTDIYSITLQNVKILINFIQFILIISILLMMF